MDSALQSWWHTAFPWIQRQWERKIKVEQNHTVLSSCLSAGWFADTCIHCLVIPWRGGRPRKVMFITSDECFLRIYSWCGFSVIIAGTFMNASHLGSVSICNVEAEGTGLGAVVYCFSSSWFIRLWTPPESGKWKYSRGSYMAFSHNQLWKSECQQGQICFFLFLEISW